MIPTVRPFCKMGTSIKRRGKVWISGEFTENKRCAMIFMLGGLRGRPCCTVELILSYLMGDEILWRKTSFVRRWRPSGERNKERKQRKQTCFLCFLNIRIAFAQHCRAGGLPLPRISPTAEFASSEGRTVCRFLPGGKGIFRLRRKIPARASPSPYTGEPLRAKRNQADRRFYNSP